MCSWAKRTKKDPKKHCCFLYWTKSSKEMEQNVIVEGFNCSKEFRGLLRLGVIGDGDSDVYNEIKIRVVSCHLVTKIECA